MADVIDDLELLITRAVNYLTHILYDLCRRLNENSHRPFNRRSLVRWIAAFMPAPKKPKLLLQSKMAGNMGLERWASCVSLASTFSASSIPVVEEELAENVVRYRRGYGDEDFDGDVFDEPIFYPHHPDGLALTSTPKISSGLSNTVAASGDTVTKEKLVEMEEELAALRKQIAMLVMAQESSSINQTGSESQTVYGRPDLSCTTDKLDSFFGSAPPPPPLPCKRSSSESITLSEQLLQKRKTSLSTHDDLTTVYKKTQQNRDRIPDMVTVLKDMRNVKLKAVQRSPGGTPIRRQPERDATDPSSIIALALKKKFSTNWCISSDSEKENDSTSFTSDLSISFGKRKIKNVKKKLNMYESSDSWTPMASPQNVETL